MKLLKSRLSRMEESAGLSGGDDEYLGLVDDIEEEPDAAAAEAAAAEAPRALGPRERWLNAAAFIALTMSEEHRALVYEETSERLPGQLAYRCQLSDPGLSNLTRQFWLMTKLKVRDEETATPRHYGLPPDVAQIYIDHALAIAADECLSCGYLSPAFPWTGNQTDCSAQEASALNLPLSRAFNIFRFFTRCPLCGGVTGGSSQAFYFMNEYRRVSQENAQLREANASPGQAIEAD
jgi:hypothetical protein